MKRLGLDRERATLFPPINLHRPRLAQLDRDDALGRVGAEKQFVFFESHSGTTVSARANQGRPSTHAAVADPLDFGYFARFDLRLEAPMPDPRARIFPQHRVVAGR